MRKGPERRAYLLGIAGRLVPLPLLAWVAARLADARHITGLDVQPEPIVGGAPILALLGLVVLGGLFAHYHAFVMAPQRVRNS
jgi:hypothetical protein